MFIFNVYAQNNANIEVIINDYENTNVEIEFYLFNIDDLYQIDIFVILELLLG